MAIKAFVPLAEGFEEIESMSIIDVLRRGLIDVTTVSLGVDKHVTGSHQVTVLADSLLDQVKDQSFDLYVLPGGMPGSAHLRDNPTIIEIIKREHEREKIIGAVCAAPIVLSRAGILDGTRITNYPGFEDELHGAILTSEPVEEDRNIITGRGPGCAIPFALKIIERVHGPDMARELGASMQVYWM